MGGWDGSECHTPCRPHITPSLPLLIINGHHQIKILLPALKFWTLIENHAEEDDVELVTGFEKRREQADS